MKLFSILTVFIYSVYADISSDLNPLTDEIVKAINDLDTSWKAGKNFDEPGSSLINKLAAPDVKFYDNFPAKVFPEMDLPASFDARKAWPNCPSIGKIYDQKKGVPSWVYAAVGSIADRLCIKTGTQIDVEATVEHLIRSNGGFNSEFNSADIGEAFNFWSKKGIFTVDSIKNSSCLPLSEECHSNEFELQKYVKVSVERTPDVIDNYCKEIMTEGPIPAYFQVKSDFPSYKSGIYVSTSKKSLGYQIVKMIGWETKNDTDYFLVANSWGTEWGEKGFARIKRERQFGRVRNIILPSVVETDILSDFNPKSYVSDQLFYLA